MNTLNTGRNNTSLNIALLEDEPSDARILKVCLESNGHRCQVFPTARSLMETLPDSEFAILLVDWELPDLTGDKVLRWVRQKLGWELPVIFVTGHDSTEDIVAMLEAGADDYITKPVVLKELLARVTALGRRARAPAVNPSRFEIDPFVVDYESFRLLRSGVAIDLTPKEFKLAGVLLENIGRLLSRQALLKDIWGYGPEISSRTIDIHISRIRKKLGLEPDNGWKLTSIYHEGYRLDRYSENKQD